MTKNQFIQSKSTTRSNQKMGKKKKSKTVSKSLHTPAYSNTPTVSIGAKGDRHLKY